MNIFSTLSLAKLFAFKMTVTTSALRTSVTARPQAAIVGGSLAGLAAAHGLERTGWSVDVYERSPTDLRSKGSGLGFVHIPSWEILTERPMMRRNRPANRSQGSYYYGDLWAFLYDGLASNDKVNIKFDKTITEIQGQVEKPIIDGQAYDLVVVADGGFSNLRKYVVGENAQPEYAGYVVWRGAIPTSKLPPMLLNDIKYIEGVYDVGKEFTIVMKMAKDNGEDMWTFGTIVATPESDLPKFWNKENDGKSRHVSSHKNSVVPTWFIKHMRTHFSHIPNLVTLVEHIIENGDLKPFPQYEFGNIDQVHKGRVVLVGDAAHMASPRTAVGAHTGILDALSLKEAMSTIQNEISDDAISKALDRYSYDGVMHAQQLYARTRTVSQEHVPRKNLENLVSPELIYGSSNQ
jgi:2-polyprenyl-6-methoxyphenol hydroxylase-like FAD-dependent oxidoreductase